MESYCGDDIVESYCGYEGGIKTVAHVSLVSIFWYAPYVRGSKP